MDFDLACTLRLDVYDNERLKTQAKLIAYECSKLWNGATDDDDYGVSTWDRSSQSEIIANDPWADENTLIC